MPVHESEVPRVYTPEGRRLRPSLAKESVLTLRAEEARARLEALQDRPEDDAERTRASLEFEEANLDLEIFDVTHDPTGALKRERIGGDLAEQMRERLALEGEPPASIATPEKITPVFLVNLSELDRLNKVSPDFGNEALVQLADNLNTTLESLIGPIAQGKPETFYKLYRADNNSFMVRFTERIPREVAEALQVEFSSQAGARWGEESSMFEERGIESPPIISDMISVESALSGLPPSLRTSTKAETHAVAALKDILYTMQDAQKIVSRVGRMREAISKDEKQARDLYDKFLKKSIAGVFTMETGSQAHASSVETYEQFKAYLLSLDADRAHADATVWEAAYGKVFADLRLRYEQDARYAKHIQNFVAEKVKEERGFVVKERASTLPPGAALPPDQESGPFEKPSRDSATEGLRAFARLRTEAGALRDNLEKAEAQGASSEERERLELATRIAEKRLGRERAMRDAATGLELRGPMFTKMEAALEDPSKRVAVLSIDMGFLKYFDQVGGRETGDLAILKAAELFEQVREEFSKEGMEVSVHRLGGDEFGMTVVGEGAVSADEFRARVREIQAVLQRKVQTGGRIPAMTGAKPGYYATNINLGVGAHLYEDGNAAQEEDAKYQLSSRLPEGMLPGFRGHETWVRNRRAEHLLKVADKVMEFRKSANRLRTMLEKMYGIELLVAKGETGEALEREEEHLKQLLAFSDKAIFGQEGRTRLADWRERLQKGEMPEALEEEVQEFVWEMMEKTFHEAQSERADLESHVEYAVRIEYLKGRITELQERLAQTEGVEERLRERYEHEQTRLRERLKGAEEDLEAIKSLRSAQAA